MSQLFGPVIRPFPYDFFPEIRKPPVKPLSGKALAKILLRNSESPIGKSILGNAEERNPVAYQRKVVKKPKTIGNFRRVLRYIIAKFDTEKAIRVLFSKRFDLSPICFRRAFLNHQIIRLLGKLYESNKERCLSLTHWIKSKVSRHEGARIEGNKRPTFRQSLNQILEKFDPVEEPLSLCF